MKHSGLSPPKIFRSCNELDIFIVNNLYSIQNKVKTKFMKLLFVTILVIFFCCSCNKTQDDINLTSFKSKFIVERCRPVIQIIEPIDERFKNSRWGTSTTIYDYSVGVGTLPDKYKDSNPFYFTISKIDSNIVHTANCSAPQYYIVINTYSDSACKISNN